MLSPGVGNAAAFRRLRHCWVNVLTCLAPLPGNKQFAALHLELAVACSRVPLLRIFQISCQALRLSLKLVSPELVTVQLGLEQAQVAFLIQLVICKGHARRVDDAVVLLDWSSKGLCCACCSRLHTWCRLLQ